MSLVFSDLLFKILLVLDGQSGNLDLLSDVTAFSWFGVTGDWSACSSAAEGLQSFSVFLDLLFDFLELAWFSGGSEDSDLSTDVLAFWVFTLFTNSVDALKDIHTGLVFSDLLFGCFLILWLGGGSESSDLGTEGFAFLWFVLSVWEWVSSLDALQGVESLLVFFNLVGEFNWVSDGETGVSDLVTDGLAFLIFVFTGWSDDCSFAVQSIHSGLVFVNLGFNGCQFSFLSG